MGGFGRSALLFVALAYSITAASLKEIGGFIERNVGFSDDDSLSFEQLRARIHVQNQTSRPVRNVHDPRQVDHIVTVNDGAGLEIQAYLTAPGRVLIQRVSLTRPKQGVPLGLQIGVSSLNDVRKVFGKSGTSEKGPGGALAERFYDPNPGGYEESAVFWFGRDGKVAGIEWRYEID
jgi:hypothetical protein